MHAITFVLVLSTSKQSFVMQIPDPGLLGLYGQHVQPLAEGDQLTATVITLVLESKKNKQSPVTITVVAMVPGQHGLSVLLHAMVAQNSEPDHTIVVLLMILKLLSAVQPVLTLCGHNGQDAHCATISASHQSWLNVHAVTLAQLNKTSRRRHVLHHAAHTGPSGVDGDHALLHVVTDSEPEFELVPDLINSVRR